MATPVFEPHRFGAYALEARLGNGGMAEVFRASREGVAGFARACVVKRILGHHNEDPSFVDMFINEAKIAAQLTHPNIVQVYELGQVDGEFFIAMEYVKGKDLLRVLRELAQKRTDDPVVPPPIAAYIARETCRALQHAHDHTDARGAAQPIIHRDVSPQNIMLSFDGQIKLVDFGIAKALGSMREETRTGALKGKFAYMAPEQINGQNPGPSADVFAAGIVLHEMLTGRRLFKGPNEYETLQKVRNLRVPVPSSIDPRIGNELDAIVMKSLERDRSLRYERAGQMARDLDGYLQTERFSVDEMSEFMRGLFGKELVEMAPENITQEYLIRPESPSGEGSLSLHIEPGEGSNVLSQGVSRVDVTANTSGGRRTLLFAGGIAVVLAIGGVYLVRQRAGNEVRTTDVVVAHGASKPEVIPLPAETRTVRLITEPAGARVFEGPKLIGETPIDLRLAVDSPGMPLTLVHQGRADLTYQVRPSDAPELTLRLQPSTGSPSMGSPGSPGTFDSIAPTPQHPAHARVGPPTTTTTKPATHKLPDDDTPTPRPPKVEAFDN